MKTELKDVIHFYIGCQIQIVKPIGAKRGKQFKLTGYQNGWSGNPIYTVHIEDRDKQYTFSLSEINPILRRLSGMTEEEKHDIARLQDKKCHQWKVDVLHLDVMLVETWGNSHQITENYWPELFVYLLSKHFDLFGLIDSNQAIEKLQ